MNWVDYVLIIIVGASVISGFMAGFARVGIGTAATIVGMFTGFWCYGLVAAHIVDYVNSNAMANIIGFFLIFFGVALIGSIIGRVLAAAFKWVGLSWLDRLLGAAFGVVRGAFIAAALTTVLLAFAPNPPPPSITQSRYLPYFVEASNVLSYATPREIKDAFRDTKDKVQKLWDEQVNRHRSKRDEV